jgi:hypothetical protein
MAKVVEVYETDGVTEAQSSYDEGTVRDGATTTARRVWFRNASTAGEEFSDCEIRRVAVGANDGIGFLETAPDVPKAAPGAPTLALAAGAGLGIGVYKYAVTFIAANGETDAGTEAQVETTGGNQQVQLSNIPLGPSGVSFRKIYRTAVGGSQKKLVYLIPNNSATSYLDSTADGSLGADVPTLNTSGAAGTWGAADITVGDMAVGDYAACWMRYDVPIGTSQVGNPRAADVRLQET